MMSPFIKQPKLKLRTVKLLQRWVGLSLHADDGKAHTDVMRTGARIEGVKNAERDIAGPDNALMARKRSDAQLCRIRS